MRTRIAQKSFVALLGALLVSVAAWAQSPPLSAPPAPLNLQLPPVAVEPPPGYKAPPTTLEKIRGYGAIYVGHREASIPFSFMDDEGKIYGYSWELCMRIVDAVKARLELPNLTVVPVLTTPSTRMMMVETGTIDLQCGSETNTDQRARYVAFSNTFFVTGVKGMVRKSSGIKTLRDLAGKTVVTTSGTTNDVAAKTAAARRNIFVNFRSGRTHLDSFQQVLEGKADVFVLDDILLHGLLAQASEADAYKLVLLDESMAFEPYGLMFRKGDAEMKKLVDETGEFERIYAKWFQSPIPPKGINLNVPMSAELKQLIKTPNDRGI